MKLSFHSGIHTCGIDLYDVRTDGLGNDLAVLEGEIDPAVADIARMAAGIDQTDAVLLNCERRMVV